MQRLTDSQIEHELLRGPRPLTWLSIFALLCIAAWLLHSPLVAVMAGMTFGYYQGYYYGSSHVVRVWQGYLQSPAVESVESAKSDRELEGSVITCKD